MKKLERHVSKVTDISKKTKTLLYQKFIQFIKTFMETVKRPDMRVLPGNLAFFLLLSIPPILTLVGVLCSMFSVHLLELMESVGEILPNDVQNIFLDFLNADFTAGTTIIYFIVGFFIASNGAHSIVVVANTLYGIDRHTYVRRRFKSIFFTIILIVLFLFILIFLVYGNIILKQILSLPMFSHIYETIYHSFVFLKWPVAFTFIFFLIKFIYRFAVDEHLPSNQTTYGALFATIGLTVVTAIYSYYANNLAHYDVFYGSLSNIIVLMMWIYIISYIFTCGMAINVSHYGKKMDNSKEIRSS